ncbi:SOS response-associated peptidase [Wenzhouxiangella sediminis]|uniref:Abasic site processing protein n=1 Tax=Wenzhouxiangella sediminis TaxID=1792836 RepID=A0A3E1KBW6_9GAMM|nr:SOS response-associated peptidase [Wenzhouxiangella sediminis]RFF32226.1 SOS response-associated peptidase [Wenzhouxiangella sediminis]
MCGRGGHEFSWRQVYEYLDLFGTPPDDGLRLLNVAPSTRRGDSVRWTVLPAVMPDEQGRRVLQHMVWPLLPPWMKGELPKFSTANCRSEPGVPFSETVVKKPTFRNAWKRGQRCLVPFSWFYEWDQRSKPKQPWRVMPATEPMLIFAGLWDESTTREGETRRSFTLITTEPNGLLREIGHHRAPVMLTGNQWQTWLTGSPEAAEQLLAPPPEDSLRAEPVSTKVNNPEYQGEDLLEPIELPQGQAGLDL